MKELLEKLTSYNLFNNLFPGVIFCMIASQITNYHLIQTDLIIGVFFYYFIGTLISRFGSLILEPVLRKLKIVNFSDYSNFLLASKKDNKIEVLSETNNSFRTMISVFVNLFLIYIYSIIENVFIFFIPYRFIIIGSVIIIILTLSYRKQTDYIRKRVENTLKEKDNA